jgi:GDP-L-fucose synthase
MAVIPTNLYGPNDNYDLNNSHVLPALIRKMHEAKLRGDKEVVVWGTGTPRREFLYSDDMAKTCLYLLEQPEEKLLQPLFSNQQPPLANVGCGEDLTIRELAELVMNVVSYNGKISFDSSKPDGTKQKLLDVSKLNQICWKAHTRIKEGIAKAYVDYLGHNMESV